MCDMRGTADVSNGDVFTETGASSAHRDGNGWSPTIFGRNCVDECKAGMEMKRHVSRKYSQAVSPQRQRCYKIDFEIALIAAADQ